VSYNRLLSTSYRLEDGEPAAIDDSTVRKPALAG
jgi:hypothetical protein